MKCFDPVLCYTDQGGTKRYRHYSLSNDIHLHHKTTPFNCGKCLFCRKKRAYSLAIRCVLHSSLYPQNCFLTLTHDEARPLYHNNFDYSEIQTFKKSLRHHVNTVQYSDLRTRRLKRRRVEKRFYKKIEIFNVHEYGKNGKKHWHLIVFNYDFSDKRIYTRTAGVPLYTSAELQNLWPHGFNTIGDVSEASAMYQAQYAQKDFKNGNAANAKKSHSKHSGIGGPYFLKHFDQILKLGFIPFGGKRIPLPRYFEKIAHKHWSHFYDKSNFVDTPKRKALYRPFAPGKESLRIADLYSSYRISKEERISILSEEWEETVSQYLTTKETPDFIKSASNYLHDINNRTLKGRL